MQTRNHHPIHVGIFRHLDRADHAVSTLVEAGYPAENLSVVCPAHAEGVFPDGVKIEEPAGERTPEAVLSGGAIGALLGGLAVGVGLAATGGVGVLVAGVLIGGAGAGAVTGGLVGAMATRGFEPEIADFYDQAVRDGRILVACDTEAGDAPLPPPETADRVFKLCGAEPLELPRG